MCIRDRFIPEENGRVYLYEKAYSDIPGLVPLGAASYAMERLEPCLLYTSRCV